MYVVRLAIFKNPGIVGQQVARGNCQRPDARPLQKMDCICYWLSGPRLAFHDSSTPVLVNRMGLWK